MEVSQWYTVSLGALVALSLIYHLFLAAISGVRGFGTLLALKHIIYPQIPKLLRGEGTITRLHALLIFLYICGNILCILFRTTNTAQLGSRSGIMSLVNLVPLCFVGRINIVANFCGLSYENYGRMHRWIGRVAVAQGLVHAVISLIRMKSTLGIAQLPGYLAAGGMLLLLLLSVLFIRRLFYEFFVKLHLLLAIATMITLWYHIPPQIVRIYPVVAILILWSTFALRILLLLYRNAGHVERRAVIQQLPDAIQVSIKVRRPWRVQAGQYLYLYAPEVSLLAWLQSHPFAIAWWYQDSDSNVTVVLLVQPYKGFTRKLQYASSSVKAFVEGPYGSERDLASYGTVIMFATGIGIAGQLLYIKGLLEGHNNRQVRTQRIFLYWQLEKECHETWVKHWMDELLEQDKHKILDISLYVLGQDYDGPVRYGKRLNKYYKPFDVQQLVRSSAKEQRGRTIVAVCADPTTKDKIRKTVREMLTESIRFVELDFQPSAMQEPVRNAYKHHPRSFPSWPIPHPHHHHDLHCQASDPEKIANDNVTK